MPVESLHPRALRPGGCSVLDGGIGGIVIFYVGLWGTGQYTWLLFDDVTVVCEAW